MRDTTGSLGRRMEIEIVTRAQALAEGRVHYFTGKPCKYGHVAPRMVSDYNCSECTVEKARRYRLNNPETPQQVLYRSAKARSRASGVAFNLRIDDIRVPKKCPALGIPLVRGVGRLHDNSPTLDRIDPDGGYVPGNIVVLSHRANRIKNNATPDELQRVADFVRRAV